VAEKTVSNGRLRKLAEELPAAEECLRDLSRALIGSKNYLRVEGRESDQALDDCASLRQALEEGVGCVKASAEKAKGGQPEAAAAESLLSSTRTSLAERDRCQRLLAKLSDENVRLQSLLATSGRGGEASGDVSLSLVLPAAVATPKLVDI